jgi:C1A family cysteine protease
MIVAMQYAETNPLQLEADYPYISGTNTTRHTCVYNSSKGVAKVATATAITPNSTNALKSAIAKGPVSVAIEADKLAFQLYSGGVLTSTACGTSLDHGVLAVGYGTDKTTGLEYYRVKNSWSNTWGDGGYVNIAITGDGAGICGIQMDPSQPTV